MREISNSLRQRMGARPEPQEHPDSDVLTAYSERLLPATERLEVVLHLAQCSYCREVVSLSLPQAPPVEEILPAYLRRSRLWIPAFRWGAAVAMLAVAATLVVEKPWKHTIGTQEPPQVSSTASDTHPVPPVTTTSTPSATTASAAPSPTELRANASAGLRRAVTSEPRAQQSRSASLQQSLGTTGFVQNGVAISQLEAVTPSRVTMAAPAPVQPLLAESSSGSVYKSAGRDYVNTNVLKNESTFTSNGLAAADANLPQAPAARNTTGVASNAVAKSPFPPISGDMDSRAFAITVVPPNTTGTPASGTPGATTLPNSKTGFRIVSKVRDEVEGVVHGIEKVGSLGGPPSGLAEFSAAKKPNFSYNKEKAQSAPLFRWRINDGILMKATDYTGWHEAYPQNSELQFKVLVTRGDQVWAGGNNATLIHSWNGGVQWETLKVPDSGDITSITIDDGWQVRTSNGQTFVSTDKGQTWVPLQAEPK